MTNSQLLYFKLYELRIPEDIHELEEIVKPGRKARCAIERNITKSHDLARKILKNLNYHLLTCVLLYQKRTTLFNLCSAPFYNYSTLSNYTNTTTS